MSCHTFPEWITYYDSWPTNSGKTFWVKRLLSYQMFMEPVKSILYCYGVHQRAFGEMNNDTNIVALIKFMQGLPTKDNIDKLNDGNFHIIILYDMMETIPESLDMCSYLPSTAIIVTFQQYFFLKMSIIRDRMLTVYPLITMSLFCFKMLEICHK